MRIAVVDDIEADRRELSVCLRDYMKQAGEDYSLEEFGDAEHFLKAALGKAFQLVFMDIYLNGMNGMDAARRLRKRDRACKLIFLTVTEDYARMGYGLSASYYLIKPLSEHRAEFAEAMSLCRPAPGPESAVLTVADGEQTVSIPAERILYIDCQNRFTRIHTACRTLSLRKPFFEVTDALKSDRRFLVCYRGILVNMDYIDRIDAESFLLTNGERIPLSLRSKKKLRETCRNYIFSQMGGTL